MLLVVDRQLNYFCVMGDKIDEARKFAIKHKGKSCEFNKATNGKNKDVLQDIIREMVLLLLEFIRILDGMEWMSRKIFLFIQDLKQIDIRSIMYILKILL